MKKLIYKKISIKLVRLYLVQQICELQEVKLLRSFSLNNTESVTAHINQNKVEIKSSKQICS